MEVPNLSNPGVPGLGSRRNEDIALDLMKFIAANTEMGKSGVGFQTATSGSKIQDNADKLLELYSRCLKTVKGS